MAAFVATPGSLTFSANVGVNPANQTDALASSASPTTELAYTLSSDQTWLSAIPAGTTPQTLTVSVNVTGLTPGIYTGNIFVNPA